MSVRHRYVRFLKKKTLTAPITHASPSAEGSSWLAKTLSYSGVIANVSQVFMLVVVVIGYFYTVRPVFQKEVVSEDLARLQLEQRKLQQQMEKQSESLQAGEAKNKALADERSAIERQILALNQKIAASEKSERDAKARAQKATAEAKTVESTLTMLQTQHYNLKQSALLGDLAVPSSLDQLLNRSWEAVSLNIFDDGAPGAVAEKLKSTDMQPIDLAKSTLSQLQSIAAKQSRAPGGSADELLAQNYQKGISRHADKLTCPAPAYEEWQSAFQSALRDSSGNIDVCVREAFEQRAKEEGWRQSQILSLKKSDFWTQQGNSYKASCEISYRWTVELAFQNAWRAADEPCEERRMYVNHIVMGAPIVSKLKALQKTMPPSPKDIDQLFRIRNSKQPEAHR